MSNALILGASGDIGEAIAFKLAKAGWSLYLHYWQNEHRAQRIVQSLKQKYPNQDFFLIKANLCVETDLDQLFNQLFQVDAFIIASGTTKYGLFAEMSSLDFDQLMKIQLQGPLYLVRKLETKLSTSGHGRIVFIGSVYGGSGSAMEVAYSTFKGAQSAFATAYAKEVASLGITVNVIAPGAVDTQMNQRFTADEKVMIINDIPAQRFAQPAEVAYMVQMLLSSEASYLTGQTLYLTGGWLK